MSSQNIKYRVLRHELPLKSDRSAVMSDLSSNKPDTSKIRPGQILGGIFTPEGGVGKGMSLLKSSLGRVRAGSSRLKLSGVNQLRYLGSKPLGDAVKNTR